MIAGTWWTVNKQKGNIEGISSIFVPGKVISIVRRLARELVRVTTARQKKKPFKKAALFKVGGRNSEEALRPGKINAPQPVSFALFSPCVRRSDKRGKNRCISVGPFSCALRGGGEGAKATRNKRKEGEIKWDEMPRGRFRR